LEGDFKLETADLKKIDGLDKKLRFNDASAGFGYVRINRFFILHLQFRKWALAYSYACTLSLEMEKKDFVS